MWTRASSAWSASIFRFPSTAYAAGSAPGRGVRAEAEGRFWPMRDRLFAAEGALSPDAIARMARDAGSRRGKDSEHARPRPHPDATVARELQDAKAAGIEATPTFILGRESGGKVTGVKIVGAQSFENFEAEIRETAARGRRLDHDGLPLFPHPEREAGAIFLAALAPGPGLQCELSPLSASALRPPPVPPLTPTRRFPSPTQRPVSPSLLKPPACKTRDDHGRDHRGGRRGPAGSGPRPAAHHGLASGEAAAGAKTRSC